MRSMFAFWLAVSLVLGFGFTITAFVLPSGYGATPLSTGIVALSITLSAFASPVLLQFQWWVTLGFLAVAFRIANQLRRTTSPAI